MDYNYAHYPNPNTQKEHQFLKSLSACPTNATEKNVTEVAKKCFNLGFFDLFFDPREKILESVNILMKESVEMPSLSEAQQEIDGAVRGLNILGKGETNESKQWSIQEALKSVNRSGQTIKDTFLIKEAIKDRPELRSVLHNRDFMQDFRLLTSIYGKVRTIDSPLIQSFILAWTQPELKPLLQAFLKEAIVTKSINIEILRSEDHIQQSRLPAAEDDHNKNLTNRYGDIMAEAPIQLISSDFKNFLVLMDSLLNQTMMPNTQIHTDGFYLAFNSDAQDTLTQRLTNAIKQSEESYQQTMQSLKKASNSSSSVDQQKTQKEMNNLEKLKGFQPRAGGVYQRATWHPMIGPEDPIRPLTRTIGFATKEGAAKESSTTLDLTKALGEENLALSIGERTLLSDLLAASDVAIRKPNVLKDWKESHTLPPNIQQVLNKFDNSQLLHLNKLSSAQKDMLVTETLRFAFEVNRHLGQDLLTL